MLTRALLGIQSESPTQELIVCFATVDSTVHRGKDSQHNATNHTRLVPHTLILRQNVRKVHFRG